MNPCQEIVDRIGTLPPLPDTAVRLMAVVNDPRSTVDQLVEAIRYDQAVTTELLRLCNSAYFGLSRRIASLNEAMVRLGTVKVMQLVMAVHTSTLLRHEQRGYGLAAGGLWRHSVGVALACGAVAPKVNLTNAGLAFTAGLLHDIGKVVLSEYVAEQFGEIIALVTHRGQSFLEAERAVLGYDHQQIGGEVAERWQLPDSIVRCIRHHHDPASLEPADPLVDTVHLADCICLMLGIGLGSDGLAYRADPEVMGRCGFHERDLETVGIQTLTDLKKVEEMFTNPGPPARGRRGAGR